MIKITFLLPLPDEKKNGKQIQKVSCDSVRKWIRLPKCNWYDMIGL